MQAFDGHFSISSNWKLVLENVVKFNRLGALLCLKLHIVFSFSHQNIVKAKPLMQLLWVTVNNKLPNFNLRKVHNYNSLKLSSTTVKVQMKKFKKTLTRFHQATILTLSKAWTADLEFHNFDRGLQGHHNYMYVCIEFYSSLNKSREKDLIHYHYTVISAYMYFALSIRPLSEKVITFTILIFSFPRDSSN